LQNWGNNVESTQDTDITGTYRRSLDDKNRVTVPSSWRVSSDEETVYWATPSPDGFVTVMPPERAKGLREKLAAVPLGDKLAQRAKARFMARTLSFTFDKQGRMPLNHALLEHAGLLDAKAEVVLVGMSDSFNLYSTTRWAEIDREDESTDLGKFMQDYGI
jgi:MraZ protein